MSYFKNINIQSSDSPSVDAFGRWRVSDTGDRFNTEFIYDQQPDIIDYVNGGSGSIFFDTDARHLELTNGDVDADSRSELLSYDIPYTPGQSQLIDITGVITNAATGTASIFLRSNTTGFTVETVVEQQDWDNAAEMTDVDWTKSQIFVMDFQSLKVGRIRYGLNRGGVFVPAHELVNDNTLTSGFWKLPSLPLSWRVYNDTSAGQTYLEIGYGDSENAIGFRYAVDITAAATLTAICGTVKSEGGLDLFDLPGFKRSIDMGVTATTVSTTLIPLISIRSKTTALANSVTNRSLTIPESFSISTDNPVKLVIYQNNTLTGASWVDVDSTQSAMEYDVTASAIVGGYEVYSEYISVVKNTAGGSSGLAGRSLIWNRRTGNEAISGIFTIAAVRSGTTDADCLVSIDWKEIR